ncbi:hypothetical protein TraAM80_04227 [Trypanosoma rangeli]|uniref:Uncharacterized protein n=1 Tax=Trypanosoma rangeli TaxID=5698 RepID=A0A3R7L203_TRYRA|nr:uncharacterized protein TraAM80_04227 [Trypanosoma rangeli]RNF05981.1 hypothetical protein TraAM80_04227 [Trypanosoma rangeli]|eukprot:RNF05981.1 hypothetical protein TraAM80_04227 [Trypanosoma rangeli]
MAKETDHRIMWVLLFINGTISVLFLLVAAYANHGRLTRSDRRRAAVVEEDRLSAGERTETHRGYANIASYSNNTPTNDPDNPAALLYTKRGHLTVSNLARSLDSDDLPLLDFSQKQRSAVSQLRVSSLPLSPASLSGAGSHA